MDVIVNIHYLFFLSPLREEVISMPCFNSKAECVNFINTKRAQGFISNSTWVLLKKKWRQCTTQKEYTDLAISVYNAIAIANGIIPASYYM